MLTADEWAGMAMTLLVVTRFQRGRDILQDRFSAYQSDDPASTDYMPSPVRDLGSEFLNAVGADVSEEEDDDFDLDNDRQEEYDVEESRFCRHMEEMGTVDGDPSVTDWGIVELLERVLAFHAFYKRGGPYSWHDPSSDEAKIRLKVREMLGMISQRLPRETGNGWNLQKFHEMLHLASNMSRLGSPQNYDAGPGESSLRVWAKKPAMTAQKKGAVRFAEQVAARLHETACFEKMERAEFSYTKLGDHLAPMWPDSIEEGETEDNYDDECSDSTPDITVQLNDLHITSKLTGLPKFKLSFDQTTQSFMCQWMGQRKQKRLVEVHLIDSNPPFGRAPNSLAFKLFSSDSPYCGMQ